MTALTLAGGCLCGQVRFTASPESLELGACHCSMCRKWSAGPFLCVDCGESIAFTQSQTLAFYRSSEWAERGFCSHCGTPLFYRLVGKNHVFASIEAFDDRTGFAFTHQIFIDEKPPYYDFANATKNMTGSEVFAAFSQGGDAGA